MKRMFLTLFAVVAAGWTGRADNKDIISFERLPVDAQSFIRMHFSDLTIAYVKAETELSGVEYEVKFTDLTKVDFNGKGEWKKVERKHSAVPDGIIPEKIGQFIQKQHAENFVKSIEKNRRGYEVELNSGLELKFDTKQKFLRYDD